MTDYRMTEQDKEVVEKVETFIRRCHDLDYILSPQSRLIPITNKQGEKKSLAECIAFSMSQYDWFKGFPEERVKNANELLVWINRAFAVGIVSEGEGLVSKNRALEARVSELQAQVSRLTEQLEKLRDTE